MKIINCLWFTLLLAGCGSAVKENQGGNYNLTGPENLNALNWTYNGIPVTASNSYFNSVDMRYKLQIQIGDKKYQGEIRYTFTNNNLIVSTFDANFHITSESNMITGNIMNNSSDPGVHLVNLNIDSNIIKGKIFITNNEHDYQIDGSVKMSGRRYDTGIFAPPAWDITINNHSIKGLMESKFFRNNYYFNTDVNTDELFLFLLLEFTYLPGYKEYTDMFKNFGSGMN
jgi:hypothetical protein